MAPDSTVTTLGNQRHMIRAFEAVPIQASRSQSWSVPHLVIASTGMVRHPPIVGGAVEAYVDDIAFMFASGQSYSLTIVSDFRQHSIPPGGVNSVAVHSPIDRFPLRPIASSIGHVVAGLFVAAAVNRYVLSARIPRNRIVLHLNEEVSAEILTRVLPRIPKVFTLHNPPPGLSLMSSTRADRTLRQLNFRLLLRFCLPRMEGVIALSSWIREYLCSDWNLEPSRVHVLPLPVDTDYFRPIPSCATENGDCHILFVGRLDHRKNVLSLIHALPHLREGTRLRLVGDGPLSKEVRLQACRLGVENRIEFFRNATPSQLMDLYRTSSIFVLPSLLEAYPRVVIEAASSGLPVVLPYLPIYRDFIQGGFVETCRPSGSPEELAESINRLVDSPGRREELGRRARDFALLHNSFDVVSRGLARIYGQVLE